MTRPMVNDPSRARLLELADARGVSLSELSRLIDRNASYLQQFIRKGSPRKLEEGDRRTLANFFAVAESELGAPEPQENSYSVRPGQKWVDVPRLPLGASAGPGALADAEDTVGHLRFSRGWLRELGLSANGLSALTVAGDSMEPSLRDGDEILVMRADGPVRDGIHVIRRDGALMVKRLAFGAPGRVAILSDNQAYPSDRDVSLSDVNILGRVVWKGGRV